MIISTRFVPFLFLIILLIRTPICRAADDDVQAPQCDDIVEVAPDAPVNDAHVEQNSDNAQRAGETGLL